MLSEQEVKQIEARCRAARIDGAAWWADDAKALIEDWKKMRAVVEAAKELIRYLDSGNLKPYGGEERRNDLRSALATITPGTEKPAKEKLC